MKMGITEELVGPVFGIFSLAAMVGAPAVGVLVRGGLMVYILS
jgi:hypothetical protein